MIKKRVLDPLEEGAIEGIKHLRAFLAYEGSNHIYHQKAKVGGVLVASYIKAEQTQTHRMALERTPPRELPPSDG